METLAGNGNWRVSTKYGALIKDNDHAKCYEVLLEHLKKSTEFGERVWYAYQLFKLV